MMVVFRRQLAFVDPDRRDFPTNTPSAVSTICAGSEVPNIQKDKSYGLWYGLWIPGQGYIYIYIYLFFIGKWR